MFETFEIETGATTRHRTAEAARRRAWRIARAGTERSAWVELDEAEIDGMWSIGIEREALVWHGPAEAIAHQRRECNMDDTEGFQHGHRDLAG